MHAVNVRQLKSNPSLALREAKNDLVVVMNRGRPDAVLVGVEQVLKGSDAYITWER